MQELTLADAAWSSASVHWHVGLSGQVLHQQECNSMLMQGDSLHPCMRRQCLKLHPALMQGTTSGDHLRVSAVYQCILCQHSLRALQQPIGYPGT